MYSPTVVHVSLTVKFAAGGTRRSSLASLVFTAALANVDRAPRRYGRCLRGVLCFKALSNGSHSGVFIHFIAGITRS